MRLTLSNKIPLQLLVEHGETTSEHNPFELSRATWAHLFINGQNYHSVAVCDSRDRFVRKKGTAIAVRKVLKQAMPGHENKKFRTEIYHKLFNIKEVRYEVTTNLQNS